MASDPSPYQAPNAAVAGAESIERSFALRALGVVGKGLVYAICIWLVYALAYPVLFSRRPNDDAAGQSTVEQQAEQVRIYEEQTRRTSELLSESERQQKRMADVLAQQEEQIKRFDAVLQAWERQSGVKR
jgi:hypothetical protein